MKVRVSENGFPFVGREGGSTTSMCGEWRVAAGGCAGCAVPDDATSAATAEEANNEESVFKTLRPSAALQRRKRLLRFFRQGRTPDAELPHQSDSRGHQDGKKQPASLATRCNVLRGGCGVA